jgi:hypothetical protein
LLDRRKVGQLLVERKADWYRAQAADCAARAKQATDPRVKTVNMDMAESWLRLAELVEKLDAKEAEPSSRTREPPSQES